MAGQANYPLKIDLSNPKITNGQKVRFIAEIEVSKLNTIKEEKWAYQFVN